MEDPVRATGTSNVLDDGRFRPPTVQGTGPQTDVSASGSSEQPKPTKQPPSFRAAARAVGAVVRLLKSSKAKTETGDEERPGKISISQPKSRAPEPLGNARLRARSHTQLGFFDFEPPAGGSSSPTIAMAPSTVSRTSQGSYYPPGRSANET
ncbi:hypothetical protein OF83DRAFT_1174192 [Amylostereum chailletii]|nr:hypothetical protein OF83DRAFT_1174192 [Amylostereum chailletii]